MILLPREAFVDENWQAREETDLFSRSWAFVGTENDFTTEGDFRTLKCGSYPILLLKSADGSLAAYHNLCRHRGTILVEGERGNLGKAMICPYHRWTYGLDGKLRGAPNISTCFPDLDKSKLGLKKAAVATFQGLVFANQDPGADFEKWLGSVAGNAWPHNPCSGELYEADRLIYDIRCNWKVFIENAIDGYHLAYLHENTLGGPKHDQNIWERHGNHMIWYATEEEGVRHSLPAKARKEYADWWVKPIKSAETPGYGGVYFLFPNILIVASPYGFSISILDPKSPRRTLLHVRQWDGERQRGDQRAEIPGFDRASGLISSEFWTQHPLETGDFQTEDVWMCERNQKGLESPAYEVGALAKGAGAEDPIGWFHEAVRNIVPD